MKKISQIILFAMLTSLVACSSDGDRAPSSKQADDPDLTGDRFFDAAATKVMRQSPGMVRLQANCIVVDITADGSIGIGELNQADLGIVAIQETPELRDAYFAAMKKCTA